jgi:DNA-directed RNA polymerase specialized sigma24 family protein
VDNRPRDISSPGVCRQRLTRLKDLVQEFYLRAFRAIHQFKPGTNLHAWLFQILWSSWLTLEDFSRGEIAGIMGCPVGTVKSRLFRVRAILKELLRDNVR